MKINIDKIAESTIKDIKKIDTETLPVSDYNREYISRLLPVLEYYFFIYAQAIDKALRNCEKSIEDIVLIDYGGGSGFLSLYAKRLGFKQVVYIDLNPDSVDTISVLKERLKYGPDVILHGDVKTLEDFFIRRDNHLPDVLISIDVIEHIYDLNDFVRTLSRINHRMVMSFTTASNHKNYLKAQRLYRMMDGCEFGDIENPNYLTLRNEYIRRKYPELSEKEQLKLAQLSRGMIFEDIDVAVKDYIYGGRNRFPMPKESNPHNTCDPSTGNYTERMLTFNEYRVLADTFSYDLKFYPGVFNHLNSDPIKKMVAGTLNVLIGISGSIGFYLAPYITLLFKRKP